MRKTTQWLPFFVLFCSAGISGCGENWAKWLEFGTRIPDARLHVQLVEPVLGEEIYVLFSEAARVGGYPYRYGREKTAQEINSHTHVVSGWFLPTERRGDTYSVAFRAPRGDFNPSSFTFIFYNTSTALFTEDEWRAFYRWKNQHIAQVFPDAEITVTKHPAEMTAKDQRRRISEATGIPLPEKYW